MNWFVITFDLDRDQPPGIQPQFAIALQAEKIYRALGFPDGFAVYHFHDWENRLYSFFFSPVAAPHFMELIHSKRGEVWGKPLPSGAEITIGDKTVSPAS